MRAHILLVLVAIMAVAHADFSSGKYQGQLASAKMSQLWQAVMEDNTPYGYYSKLQFATIFFERMKPTFDSYSDEMPDGHKKLIHSVGNVGKVEFIADENEYTGVFQGAKNVLLRLSLAKQADPKKPAADNFAPGLAIKFLRDGVPSANLVAMKSLEGQDSWNFFKYEWSHHISAPCTFALKIAAKKFEEATPFTTRIGLKAWAEFDQYGKHVAEPKIPFRIWFKPTSAVKNLFPDTYSTDFTKQLSTIKPETDIYDIYAVPKPHADAVKIGTLRSKTTFYTSKFGDKDLFFQHNYLEDDIKLNPTWASAWKEDPPAVPRFV